jgi:hypothetical protein
MRVEYTTPVQDRIHDAIDKAKEQNRTIKRIVLSPDEWNEFYSYACAFQLRRWLREAVMYRGVTIVREDN